MVMQFREVSCIFSENFSGDLVVLSDDGDLPDLVDQGFQRFLMS
jgi:hypothetical protein